MVLLTISLIIVKLITLRLAILVFYRSRIVISVKLYVVLFNIFLVATKTKLFK